MLALCAFLLLAFFSYTPADPGWSHSGPEDRVANWMGPAGAWLSDVLYSLFGASALWGPAILGLGAWRLMRAREAHLVWDPVALAVRGGGMLLVLLATSTLGALHFQNPASDLPYGAGGIVGVGVSTALSSLVGIHGATLLSLAAFLCGMPLLTGFSWLLIIDELGRVAISATRRCKSALGRAGTRLGDKRREMALERRRSYEAAQQEDDIDFGHDDEFEETPSGSADARRGTALWSRLKSRLGGSSVDASEVRESEPTMPAGRRTEPSLSTREDDFTSREDDTIPWEQAGRHADVRAGKGAVENTGESTDESAGQNVDERIDGHRDESAPRTVASSDQTTAALDETRDPLVDDERPAATERVDAALAATGVAATNGAAMTPPADDGERESSETESPETDGFKSGFPEAEGPAADEPRHAPRTSDRAEEAAPAFRSDRVDVTRRRMPEVIPEPQTEDDDVVPAWGAPKAPADGATSSRGSEASEPSQADERAERPPALEWEEDEPLSPAPLRAQRGDDTPAPENRFTLVFDENEGDETSAAASSQSPQVVPSPAPDDPPGVEFGPSDPEPATVEGTDEKPLFDAAPAASDEPVPGLSGDEAPREERAVEEMPDEDQDSTPTLWTVQQMQTQQRPGVDESQAPVGRVPPLALLTPPSAHEPTYTAEQLEDMAELLEVRLREYGVKAEVVDTWPGPVITRFEIKPAPGVKVSKISNLAKDLARSLMVKSVRVVEIIPGRPTVGIEIPNPNRAMIRLREVFDSDVYQDARSPVTVALGQDIGGNPVVANLNKMPHLLVAGTTGSGKSVGVNAMLISMLLKATPDEVRMIMVDPKMLELSVYDGIPHLLAPVVTDMKEAANALRWCVAEMERRYKLMAAMGVRNLAGFNARIDEATEAGAQIADPLWEPQPWEMHVQPPVLEKLPYIVVVIDEFADMFMIVGKKVEELIARIAQKARAAGIHLILATQRPSVDVVTGLIKANIPTRMAFQVSSRIDSRTILDQGGAEHLLGHGDMLYLPAGAGMPTRVHGAFVDDDEVHRVVDDWKRRGEPEYIDEILSGGVSADGLAGLEAEGEGSDDPEQDALYDEAVAYVTESRRASISAVQRRFKIGYNRAARLVEAMEGAGVVSSMGSNGSREVLASPPAH